jgi:fatty acid CoA ligase FadD36
MSIFKQYLNKPIDTMNSFDTLGWFRTGDIAQRDKNNNYYILGRNSMDIIKVCTSSSSI